MLEISYHIIVLYDTIPQVDFFLTALRHLFKLGVFDGHVVEVASGAIFLCVPQDRLSYSSKVCVIIAVELLCNVFSVKFFQVVHCNNQVELWFFLNN